MSPRLRSPSRTDPLPRSVPRPRIGFVAIVRPLFKGDTDAVLQDSLAALERLAEGLGFELALGPGGRPTVVADAQAAQAAADACGEREIDLLLVQFTTFATGDVLAPLLAAAPRVGLWGVPERAAGCGSSGPLPLNSLCGLTMGLSIAALPRSRVRAPVKWFYGRGDSAGFRERLAVSVAAVRAAVLLEQATVLAIGGTAPGFYALEEAPAALPVRVERRPLSELFERVASVPDARARARAAAFEAGERSEVTREQLERAARIDLALAAMAAEADADALAVRCWPELPQACDSMACLAMAEQAAGFRPAACEGDVMGAVSMLALQGISDSPAILMDLADVDPASDSLLLWHCGNAPLAWAAREPDGRAATRLTTHFNRDGVGVVRDLRLRAGALTGLRFLEDGRAAVLTTGCVEDPERDGFDGVRGWVSDLRMGGTPVDVETFLANLLDRRLPHHLAFGMGAHEDAVRELCAYLGSEVLPVLERRDALRPAVERRP